MKLGVENTRLIAIGDAIRNKRGTQGLYSLAEMPDAIEGIEAEAVIEQKNISANGTYNAPTGVDGFSPVVVNVPNSYSASDEGKVVDNGALVAQTSRTIDENGTYDTTTNNEVIVNVEGGGGESSTFNFPDYLAHSDQTKIAVSAKPDDFTSGSSSWGDADLNGTVSKEDYFLLFNGGYASYDLENANTDVTIYAVVRQHEYQSGDRIAISNSYAFSSGNSVGIYSGSGTLKSTVWGGDVTLGSALDWHVIAMSITGGSSVSFYVDGVFSNTQGIYNNGASAWLNYNGNSANIGKWDVLFFGVVKEAESQATIIANQEDLLAILKMTQFMNEYSDYLDTPVIAGASEPQSAIGENGDLFVEFEIESNVTNLKNTYNKVNGEWVKNSGGGGEPIDYSYLPNSDADNVLASSDYTMLDGLKVGAFDVFVYPSLYNLTSTPFELTVDANGLYLQYGVKVGKWLSDANTDVTMYFVGKRTSNSRNFVFMDIPYALSNGNSPSFYNNQYTYAVESTIFASNEQTGYSSDTEHIYAISLDASTKTAKWYIDGNLLRTYNYGNSGNIALIGGGVPTTLDYDSDIYFKYGGVVEECESDATIIANMQAIATKLGITI